MNIKYVFFDCWDTVIKYHENEPNGDMKANHPYLVEKDKVSPDDLSNMLKEIEKKYYSQNEWEVPCTSLLALLIELNGLHLTISYEEAEKIMVRKFLVPEPMPQINLMLDYLNKKGIKHSILSNTTISEELTKEFVDRLLPNNSFEFLVASSRVATKKPQPLFFKLGAAKAGVKCEECLYIGDTFSSDVFGSSSANMNPAWLNWKNKQPNPNYHVRDFIEVENYEELINILEGKVL